MLDLVQRTSDVSAPMQAQKSVLGTVVLGVMNLWVVYTSLAKRYRVVVGGCLHIYTYMYIYIYDIKTFRAFWSFVKMVRSAREYFTPANSSGCVRVGCVYMAFEICARSRRPQRIQPSSPICHRRCAVRRCTQLYGGGNAVSGAASVRSSLTR